MASDALRQRAEMMRTVVHELRTPLQTIHGFAHLLEQSLPTEEFDQALTLIRQDSSRLIAMLDDLGWRTRLDADELTLTRELVALGPLLVNLSQEFERQFPDHFLVLRASDQLQAVADPNRAWDVIWALVRYAARNAPPGPITVSARRMRTGVVLRVHDRGRRVPARYAEAIFLERAPVPRGWGWPALGLGLGLYVGRVFARRMGGDLQVEPAGARGAHMGNAFVLTLPAGQADVE
jgi:signal transduction histidine kinase